MFLQIVLIISLFCVVYGEGLGKWFWLRNAEPAIFLYGDRFRVFSAINDVSVGHYARVSGIINLADFYQVLSAFLPEDSLGFFT